MKEKKKALLKEQDVKNQYGSFYDLLYKCNIFFKCVDEEAIQFEEIASIKDNYKSQEPAAMLN